MASGWKLTASCARMAHLRHVRSRFVPTAEDRCLLPDRGSRAIQLLPRDDAPGFWEESHIANHRTPNLPISRRQASCHPRGHERKFRNDDLSAKASRVLESGPNSDHIQVMLDSGSAFHRRSSTCSSNWVKTHFCGTPRFQRGLLKSRLTTIELPRLHSELDFVFPIDQAELYY